jgi:hypothetical protein
VLSFCLFFCLQLCMCRFIWRMSLFQMKNFCPDSFSMKRHCITKSNQL